MYTIECNTKPLLRRGFLYTIMKIELNKQLDKEVYLAFRDAVVGGADFGKKIRADHPEIALDNYSGYIDNFYISRNDELEEIRKDTESCFNDVKNPLFSELKKYFGCDYNKENYICYLSIFNCNPRYLETKSFQVYYKRSRDMRKVVIAREITHFAFYDFCQKLGLHDNNELWELSEIFNVIFLNLPPIQKAIGAEELLFYPDLKDKLEKVKKIWAKQLEVKDFIIESLQCLR